MSFFTKTIDSIVADIVAKIEGLHVVAEAHAEAAKLHGEIIIESTKAREFFANEYARAKAIAAKLETLVRP